MNCPTYDPLEEWEDRDDPESPVESIGLEPEEHDE